METWVPIKEYQDLLFERVEDGIAKITINRPEVRNAFRPQTIMELVEAFELCRADTSMGVVILTGQGPDAFCSGADLKIGHDGYIGGKGAPRANILDVQKQIRALPKPVIAMVAGYAIGGGHVLHVVCDITIAADDAVFGEPEIRFSNVGPALVMPFVIGLKRARELLYLGDTIDASTALSYGMVNRVVPRADLAAATLAFARRLALISPEALAGTKLAINRGADAAGLRNAIRAGLDVVAPLYAARTEVGLQFDEIRNRDGLGAALRWRAAQFGG